MKMVNFTPRQLYIRGTALSTYYVEEFVDPKVDMYIWGKIKISYPLGRLESLVVQHVNKSRLLK
jgi:hypothetical protein